MWPEGTAITPQDQRADLPTPLISLWVWHLHNQSEAGLPRCVPSSLLLSGTGILTCCPSPTLFSLGLGPTNPTRTDLPSETLGLRRTRFSRVLRYSFRHSHFCTLHPSFPSSFDAVQNAPLPIHNVDSAASVLGLSPVTFSAQDRLTSELLRTL